MLKHWGALASRQALRSMMLVTVPPSSCTMVSMAGVTDTALPWAATEATHWEMVSSLTKGLTPSCTSTCGRAPRPSPGHPAPADRFLPRRAAGHHADHLGNVVVRKLLLQEGDPVLQAHHHDAVDVRVVLEHLDGVKQDGFAVQLQKLLGPLSWCSCAGRCPRRR